MSTFKVGEVIFISASAEELSSYHVPLEFLNTLQKVSEVDPGHVFFLEFGPTRTYKWGLKPGFCLPQYVYESPLFQELL